MYGMDKEYGGALASAYTSSFEDEMPRDGKSKENKVDRSIEVITRFMNVIYTDPKATNILIQLKKDCWNSQEYLNKNYYTDIATSQLCLVTIKDAYSKKLPLLMEAAREALKNTYPYQPMEKLLDPDVQEFQDFLLVMLAHKEDDAKISSQAYQELEELKKK